jgi:hypothetical protein
MTNDLLPPPPIENCDNNSYHDKTMQSAQKEEAFFPDVQVETQEENKSLPVRDNKGRFLTGNTAGGRKKGKRNKLTELFLNTIAEDFEQHGSDTLRRLRIEDPAMYMKMIAVLIPKNLIHQFETEPDIDYENITNEELTEIAERNKRKQFVQHVLEHNHFG